MGRAFEYRRFAKEKRWDRMSKLFPKLSRAITLAARAGSDPLVNAKLRVAIATAKSNNMPKDNIEAAIKRASGKDGNFEYVTYEGKGPGGALIFIECATDNRTRTVANIKSYFNKVSGASLLENGSIGFMFARKSVFLFTSAPHKSLDDIELHLIDYGLESLEVSENGLMAYGSYEEFGNLSSGIEAIGSEIISANLVRFPLETVDLDSERLSEVERLLFMIEEDDDVQAVYTNVS